MTPGGRVLTIVACGAGPAAEISICVKLAQDGGWTVQVIDTPQPDWLAPLWTSITRRATSRSRDFF